MFSVGYTTRTGSAEHNHEQVKDEHWLDWLRSHAAGAGFGRLTRADPRWR
jgi:hypothetical protein